MTNANITLGLAGAGLLLLALLSVFVMAFATMKLIQERGRR